VLVDRGEHRLKDLGAPERLWQLGEGEFAPLRTLETVRHNLPVQVSSFVGRDGDVERVVEGFSDHRVVTLVGVGGVGKTRLAVQTAAHLADRYPDGVWLVELASVDQGREVPVAVATTLPLNLEGERSASEVVCGELADQSVLLVLDNCEHLLDEVADLVEELTHSGSGCAVMATSREPLGVDGEQVMVVRSLAGVAAVELFENRAASQRDGRVLTSEEQGAAGELCDRLDGILWAIELAAARVRSMPVVAVLERLDQRFRLLRGGRRRAVDRHQTLRNTVQWSFDLLNTDERARCPVSAVGDVAGVRC